MTKEIQFKLDLNLPHILASFAIRGAGGVGGGGGVSMHMVEMAFVALSIYDDAAVGVGVGGCG